MRGGFLSASLFLELLERSARNNRLHEVLRRPVDIAFFVESEDGTKATASTSFRYPEGRASSVAMVMCDHNGSHFQRLRSGSRPSQVLTPERHITFQATAGCRHRQVRSQEPVWSSDIASPNKFAALASLERASADLDADSDVASSDLGILPGVMAQHSLRTVESV